MKKILFTIVLFGQAFTTLSYADNNQQTQSIMYSQNSKELTDKNQSVDFFAIAKQQEKEVKLPSRKHHLMSGKDNTSKRTQAPDPVVQETQNNESPKNETPNQTGQ